MPRAVRKTFIMKIILNSHGLPTRARRLKRRRLLPNRRKSAQHVGHRDGKGTSAPLRPTRNVANMNTFMSSVAAIALIGAIDVALIDLLDVPALAAPSGTESAQETITALQASGYKVIVNKVGAVPLAQCTVTAARPGRNATKLSVYPAQGGYSSAKQGRCRPGSIARSEPRFQSSR
jgi:hypothetical protein